MHWNRILYSLVIVVAANSAFAQAPMSSSFPGPLWEVVAPAGGTASVQNTHLMLNVPGGSNHDALLPSNQALRVVQPIGDVDFDVSIKIDSPIAATTVGTSQGLMALADAQNFVAYGLATDGTNLSLNAHIVTAGAASTVFNNPNFNEYHSPMFLRLKRSGNIYAAFYSVDGVVWTQAASFTGALAPTSVGPFAANYNSTPARAAPVVMAINWFNIL